MPREHCTIFICVMFAGCDRAPPQEPKAVSSVTTGAVARASTLPMHPACSFTGQQPRRLEPAPAAQPRGIGFGLIPSAPRTTGYVMQTQPTLVLDNGWGPFSGKVTTGQPLRLQYGEYVDVAYQYIGGNEVLEVKHTPAPADAPRTLFTAWVEPGRLVVLHDGSAYRGSPDEPIELDDDDVETLMRALGKADVEQVAEAPDRKLVLNCHRHQRLPPESVTDVMELAHEVLEDALRREKYRLKYVWSGSVSVEDWPFDRTDVLGVAGGAQEPADDLELPLEFAESVPVSAQYAHEQATVFRHADRLFWVERETAADEAEITTFADLTAHECGASDCLQLPAGLVDDPDGGLVLTYDQVTEFWSGISVGEHSIDGWAISGDRVFGGLSLVRSPGKSAVHPARRE